MFIRQPIIRSPLKWAGKKSELYELLIAFDNLDIITKNGVPASFCAIVREFSRTVGLPYDTDCHNERRRTLTRNTRRTMSKGLENSIGKLEFHWKIGIDRG